MYTTYVAHLSFMSQQLPLNQTLQVCVTMVMFVWWVVPLEGVWEGDAWRCATMRHGGQSVTTAGHQRTPESFVLNSDSYNLVEHLVSTRILHTTCTRSPCLTPGNHITTFRVACANLQPGVIFIHLIKILEWACVYSCHRARVGRLATAREK